LKRENSLTKRGWNLLESRLLVKLCFAYKIIFYTLNGDSKEVVGNVVMNECVDYFTPHGSRLRGAHGHRECAEPGGVIAVSGRRKKDSAQNLAHMHEFRRGPTIALSRENPSKEEWI